MSENQISLRRVIPALAESFGIPNEEMWSSLQRLGITLERVVSLKSHPKARQLVNQGWRRYGFQFSSLLGISNKMRPAKLSEDIYEQLLCLICAIGVCSSGKMARKWRNLCNWSPKVRISARIPIGMQTWLPKIEKPVSKTVRMSLWQRFIVWLRTQFKNLFGRRWN